MGAVVERENMTRALRRMQVSKGAPGIDSMTFDELLPYLHGQWPRIIEDLMNGTYKPASVPSGTGGPSDLGTPKPSRPCQNAEGAGCLIST